MVSTIERTHPAAPLSLAESVNSNFVLVTSGAIRCQSSAASGSVDGSVWARSVRASPLKVAALYSLVLSLIEALTAMNRSGRATVFGIVIDVPPSRFQWNSTSQSRPLPVIDRRSQAVGMLPLEPIASLGAKLKQGGLPTTRDGTRLVYPGLPALPILHLPCPARAEGVLLSTQPRFPIRVNGTGGGSGPVAVDGLIILALKRR
jgi:hypothetical protein